MYIVMMPQSLTQVTPDSFVMMGRPSFPLIDPTIIFVIPGNPGVISFYHLFLSLLVSNLSSEESTSPGTGNGSNDGVTVRNQLQDASKHAHAQFYVYGKSLGGFEIQTGPDSGEGGKLYGLKEQIEFVEKGLEDCVNRCQRAVLQRSVDGPESKNERNVRPKVILIGHSVGAYTAMEVLRRHREKRKLPSDDINDRTDIVAGILLFPTVMDIAKSPSGRILTVCVCVIYFIAIEIPSAFYSLC